VFKTRTSTSDYFYNDYLKYNTDYYWQIRPIVDLVKGPWSSVFKFSSMNPLLAPIILTPINKALQTTNPSIFEWEQVENATGYKIVIAKDLAFTIKEQIGTGDSTSFEGSLKSGKYFWRVRAFDFYGAKSPWSEVRIIKILLE